MTYDFNNQSFAFAKQFTDNMFRAQAMALQGAQTVAALQYKALETQAALSSELFSDARETRDMDGFRALWEKSTSMGRENAERAVSMSQEIFAVTQKTAESLTAMAQEQQQAANDAVSEPAAAPKKASAK